MNYKSVVEATFLTRPNRFIAEVLIDDEPETIHVRNTGRCHELLVPEAQVILEDCRHVPNRKTRYSLISVWKSDMLVNMDSQIPNDVVFNALKSNKIEGFENLDTVKREVTFGDSRFDIFYESNGEKGFIEVKGVTLENSDIAMFPDAPTTRGSKHVLEMIEAVEQGYRGAILFLIQMKGPKEFRLNWEMDEDFAQAIKLAHKKGVKILAYDSIVKADCITIDQAIPIDISTK